MKILAFESSCDETAVAVVEDGRRVLSDAIALYGARGFRGGGRRKEYYEHAKEDGISMTREVHTDGTEDTVPGAAADRL